MLSRHIAAAFACLLGASALGAQRLEEGHEPRSPISIGNYPNVSGLRINFRDEGLERVAGVNLTIWSPHDPATGVVHGVALGLPLTGAGSISGFGTGLLGVGASNDMHGVMLAPVGAGAGGHVRGIAIGGVGVGAGGDLTGLFVGGVGAGAGGSAKGVLIGGVGAGVGGNIKGAAFGLVGAGAGGNARGLFVGGVGVGAGGDIEGVLLGGVGAGAGGNVTGLSISGVATGAGGTLKGVALAGVAVGAPRLEGGFSALVVGAKDARAVVIAPGMFKIERGGSFRGGSLSAINDIRGSQTGITIGLFNYARSVRGVQIGVINVIADQQGHRVLPLVNWGER